MIEERSLADIIQAKVALGTQNARGFYDVRCALCSDNLPRGAFRFDGDSTGYACFHCGAKARYEEGSGHLSKNFRRILEAFGITKEDLVGIRSALLSHRPVQEENVTLDGLQKVKLFTPEVALPEKSLPIGSPGYDELQEPLIEYLLNRKIDPLEAAAHFSLDKKYLRRVIIPYFRDGRIIYWQARAIDSDVKPRYLNSPVARDAVLYGYNQLYQWSDLPLFVTEGVFDAIVLKGVSTLGAGLNEAKLEVLRRSKRRLIFVIDRDQAGGVFGQTALENGWEISFVDERASDANQSVQLFGLPYTIYTLIKNATTVPTFTDQSKLQLSLGLLMGKLRGNK